MIHHPLYGEAVRRYTLARRLWRENSGVREAALLLGLSERAYCDALVNGTLWATFTTYATNLPPWEVVVDMAWAAAGAALVGAEIPS